MDGHIQRRKYESIPGYFTRSPTARSESPKQSSGTQIPPRFGLVDQSPERWVHLKMRLKELNDTARPGESYKLVFFWRHGQSFHNVGKAKYGTQEWKRYWSRLDGDGEFDWGDSDLTSTGVAQALHIKAEWQGEQAFGLPLPDKIYTSPLTRALRTCDITFDWMIEGPAKTPVLAVENCREKYGLYGYDKRRSLTYIKTEFPRFNVNEGFTEEDELWVPDARETAESMAARARSVLDMIFDEHTVTYACCVIHGGLLNAFLDVLGQPKTSLQTGGLYPIIVRGY